MLSDETCWFLAADFDKKSWMTDAAAFRDAARAKGVPIAIERSRSGNGAHAWIFFAEPYRLIKRGGRSRFSQRQPSLKLKERNRQNDREQSANEGEIHVQVA